MRSLPKGKPDDVSPVESGVDPIREFVWSLLLWDSTRVKASRAMERIDHHVVDYNELRISLPDEVQEVLGKRYPRCEDRSFIIQKSLNAIFLSQNDVSLEGLVKMPKREARKALESFDATPPYVAARVMLLALGGHAIPIDDAMHERLLGEGVLEEGTDLKKAISLFERVVKAGDGHRVHAGMLKWIEKKLSRAGTRKKTTRKKTTRKKSTKK
ncbi:MAG: hypothetical protein ACF8GE_05570 [Phycisphaerales bacterium JB043]